MADASETPSAGGRTLWCRSKTIKESLLRQQRPGPELRRRSMTEVTFLLGFSESAHFTRAFRRWTGMAPRQFATLVRGGGARKESGELIRPPSHSAIGLCTCRNLSQGLVGRLLT